MGGAGGGGYGIVKNGNGNGYLNDAMQSINERRPIQRETKISI